MTSSFISAPVAKKSDVSSMRPDSVMQAMKSPLSQVNSSITQSEGKGNSNLPRNIGAKEAEFGHTERGNWKKATQNTFVDAGAYADMKTASTGEAGNVRLTEADATDYLNVGVKQSVRNAKQAAVASGEKIVLTSEAETRSFIERVLAGEESNTTRAYGKVGAAMADDIYNRSTGAFDVENWYLELTPSDLRHAYSQHMNAKQSGNIDLSEQDFLNIPQYIDTYDDILDCYTYGNGEKTILIGKKINGYSVIVEVVSNNRKSIHFKNMWGLDTKTYESRYKKESDASRPGRSSNNANDPQERTTSLIENTTPAVNASNDANTFTSKTTEPVSSNNSILNSPEKINNIFSQVIGAKETQLSAGSDDVAQVYRMASETQRQLDGVAPQISAEQKRRPTIINQLKNAIPRMQDMQPVANVTGNEIQAEGTVVERLMNFVSSIGGKISRNGFGDVIFSRTKIKNGIIGHGVGRSKFETFAAVPAVIKYGTQIDYVENYMGRGYDTYVFAAPINYKNNISYLGVVVTKDARDGRYYVHEVVDGNGDLIFVDKENQETPISHRQDVPGHPDPEASPDSRDVVRQAGLPDTFDTVSASA